MFGSSRDPRIFQNISPNSPSDFTSTPSLTVNLALFPGSTSLQTPIQSTFKTPLASPKKPVDMHSHWLQPAFPSPGPKPQKFFVVPISSSPSVMRRNFLPSDLLNISAHLCDLSMRTLGS